MASSLAEAFKVAGTHPADVEFEKALAKYFNSGGTVQRMWSICNCAAVRMSGGGQAKYAGKAEISLPPARQPVEEGKANNAVPRGQLQIAKPSSPNREQAAFGKLPPNKGQTTPAQPAREPSITSIAARGSAKLAAARTVLDLRKTSDGRPWGDVGAHELDGMYRDGAIAVVVRNMIGSLLGDRKFSKLRDLLSPAQFEEALIQAERSNA